MKTTIIPPHSLAQTSQAHCMRRPFLDLCVSLLHYFVPVTLPFNGVSEAVCTNFYYACIFQQRVCFKAIDIVRREQIEQSSCVFGIALTLLLHLCESTTLSKNKNIRNSKYISQEKEIKKQQLKILAITLYARQPVNRYTSHEKVANKTMNVCNK